jgi:hypothetical protein
LLFEEQAITVDEVIGGDVAPMDERILAFDDFPVAAVVRSRHHIRIILPNRRTGCVNGDGIARAVLTSQVSHGRGQHQHVARGEKALKE